MDKADKIKIGSKYHLIARPGVFIVKSFTRLLGKPAVVVKRKYRYEYMTVLIEDLRPVEKKK